MDKIDQLANYIEHCNSIVAITGAGISVAGGGMTYWQMSLSNRRAGVNPRSGNGYKDFLPTYLDNMFSYEPSFAHYALANLEAEGKMLGIITTNVDCMHTIAGSKNVAEIQGSLQVNCCSKCGRHYDGYDIWRACPCKIAYGDGQAYVPRQARDNIWKKDDLPLCEVCGGEVLPWPLYSHIGLWDTDVRKAQVWISRADLILVIGTQGNYGNAYWGYRNRDAVIVQINPGHTGFDRVAALNIREGSDEVFKKLEERRSGES